MAVGAVNRTTRSASVAKNDFPVMKGTFAPRYPRDDVEFPSGFKAATRKTGHTLGLTGTTQEGKKVTISASYDPSYKPSAKYPGYSRFELSGAQINKMFGSAADVNNASILVKNGSSDVVLVTQGAEGGQYEHYKAK
jgi:hypothetical protein